MGLSTLSKKVTPANNNHDIQPDGPSAAPNKLFFLRDYQFWNIVGVSIAFMILFTAYNTCAMLQASVLTDVHDDYFNGTGKEGYYSLAISYSLMAVSNWITPSVIAYTGPKYGMVLGGIPYCLFMATFLRPFLGTLYAGSVLIGFGAAILWTALPVFLTVNSTDATMSRNVGCFWAILQLSYLWGSSFAAIELNGQSKIDPNTRSKLFIALVCVAIVGISVMLFLRYPGQRDRGKPSPGGQLVHERHTWRQWAWLLAIKSSFKLLLTRNILLLIAIFAYCGFSQTFVTSVFGTSLQRTRYFGSERYFVLGLSGVLIGVGEVSGGATCALLGIRLKSIGRSLLLSAGVGMQLISYLIIFLFLPADSPLTETDNIGYILPNKHLAMFCSFFLGFGNASMNTQIYALLGNTYSSNSTVQAFALFKFIKASAAAIGFFYSTVLSLPAQLGIVAGVGLTGTFTFCAVERLIVASTKLVK